MPNVTLDLAQTWLRDIANSDPGKVAKCNYATETEDGFDPDCIIGVMLHRIFHLDPAFLATLGSVFSAVYQEALPFVTIEPEALYYMCLVQGFQDGAACNTKNWADSVDSANRAMRLIDAVGGSYTTDSLSTVQRVVAAKD